MSRQDRKSAREATQIRIELVVACAEGKIVERASSILMIALCLEPVVAGIPEPFSRGTHFAVSRVSQSSGPRRCITDQSRQLLRQSQLGSLEFGTTDLPPHRPRLSLVGRAVNWLPLLHLVRGSFQRPPDGYDQSKARSRSVEDAVNRFLLCRILISPVIDAER